MERLSSSSSFPDAAAAAVKPLFPTYTVFTLRLSYIRTNGEKIESHPALICTLHPE
jgi:hypothetical protein